VEHHLQEIHFYPFKKMKPILKLSKEKNHFHFFVVKLNFLIDI